MNTTTSMTQPGTFPAMGKGTILPSRAVVIIPAGLDATIKRTMASAIRRDMAGFPTSNVPADGLFHLGLVLGSAEQSDAYTVTLYGHEIKTLHSFLYDQQTRLNALTIGLEPTQRQIVRARLLAFLTQLQQVSRGVDLSWKRPVMGES